MAVDSYSKEQMIALGITFLVLPCIFVALRFWAKWLSRKAFQWDDFFILVALVGVSDFRQDNKSLSDVGHGAF